MCRVRNLLAKFCEFSVYKVIASHPHKPKIRNISPKFSKLAKGGAELTHHTIPKAVDLTDAKLRTDEDHSFYIGVLKKKINWRM